MAVRNHDCIVSSIQDELNKFAFRGLICIILYRIAGKFDGDLNLANWRFWTATAKVYSRQIYELKYLGRSKPPNILLVKFSGYTVYNDFGASIKGTV